MNNNGFTLGHSVLIVPLYVTLGGLIIYVFGITGMEIWGSIWVFVCLCWFIFLSYWHRVSYQSGAITGILFPNKPVSIKVSDITTLRKETDLFRLETRRCIAIHDDRNHKVVKVSLSVFLKEDVQRLIDSIYAVRPDLPKLDIPRYWMGAKW